MQRHHRLGARLRARHDRREQHEPRNPRWTAARESQSGYRAPRMCDYRQSRHLLLLQDETHGRDDLLGGLFRRTERRVTFGRLVHLGIAVRTAVAQKVEAPHMEAGVAQLIAPRATLAAMRDGERRRKRRAMNVEDCFTFRKTRTRRCEMPQENAQTGARGGYQE